ncbi:zinc finger protein 233-like [Acropora millepora]|uniref:zinc finger protein 233-like n=1 Tax=Acropora millepora TaxID=45264 RepID=UPI001CF2B4FB|nr:zinc finger protein 233-like [Acropora millepora]
MEGTKDLMKLKNSNFQSGKLKRKSEEGAITEKSIDIPSEENERPSCKIRKCTTAKLPAEKYEQGDMDVKEKGSMSCKSSSPLQFHGMSKNLSGAKDGRKPLERKMENLIKHKEQVQSAAGVILSSHTEKPYKCIFCDKQFKHLCNLKSHGKIVHKKDIESSFKICMDPLGRNGQGFQCEICFRDFKYISNLRTHRLVHTCNDTDVKCEQATV